MTATRRAPATSLLGQVRAGAGWALLGISALVVLWGGASLGTLMMPKPAPLVRSDWWAESGTGSDVTTAFSTAGGMLSVSWRSRCPMYAVVTEWDGSEVGRSLAFAHGREGTRRLPLPPGSYFFEVTAACGWRVAINPT